ncbi:MAG: hypothetical protein WC269_04305 [Candidatus Gracilibacteria bacterium]|jgi:hypothetical protein
MSKTKTTAEAVKTEQKPKASAKAGAKPKAVAVEKTEEAVKVQVPATAGRNGLEELEELTKGLVLAVENMPEIPDLTDLDDTIEGMVANIRKIEEGIPNALSFLAEVDKKIDSYKEDQVAYQLAKSRYTAHANQMKEYIDRMLKNPVQEYRAAAARSYLRTVFSQQIESLIDAAKMLADLVTRELLVMMGPEGLISIGHCRYNLNNELGLYESDVEGITRMIADFSRRIKQLEGARREEQVKEMKAQAEITLEQAMEFTGDEKNKNPVSCGKCLVEVPAEQKQNGEWLGGGNILLDFQQDKVVVIRASGAIEKLASDMYVDRLGVRILVTMPRYMMWWDKAPAMGQQFDKFAWAIKHQHGLSDREAENYVRKLQTLWHLSHRGVKANEDRKATRKARQEMKVKANISPADFFGLNGLRGLPKLGKAFLEFNGELKTKDSTTLFNPFFLTIRDEDDDGQFIQIDEIPPHLERTMSQYVGRRFPASKHYPENLARLLSAVRSQVDMEVQKSIPVK